MYSNCVDQDQRVTATPNCHRGWCLPTIDIGVIIAIGSYYALMYRKCKWNAVYILLYILVFCTFWIWFMWHSCTRCISAWCTTDIPCFQKQKFCSYKFSQVLWTRRLPCCTGTWHKRKQDCMEGNKFTFMWSNNVTWDSIYCLTLCTLNEDKLSCPFPFLHFPPLLFIPLPFFSFPALHFPSIPLHSSLFFPRPSSCIAATGYEGALKFSSWSEHSRPINAFLCILGWKECISATLASLRLVGCSHYAVTAVGWSPRRHVTKRSSRLWSEQVHASVLVASSPMLVVVTDVEQLTALNTLRVNKVTLNLEDECTIQPEKCHSLIHLKVVSPQNCALWLC